MTVVTLKPSELTSAVLQQGIAIVTQLTPLAGSTFRVVQTAQTLAGSGVTGLWVQHINIIVALTGLTLPTGLTWVSIVTR